MSFVHLQVSSAFSLLSSTISIEKLVERAKHFQYHSLAITDRNVMYGAIPFYKACLKNNIKPIIGMTTDVISKELEDKSFPLVLLAKNEIGYQNLLKISSVIGTKSPNGISMKWLKGYARGLIAITPGIGGEIEHWLLQDDEENAVIAMKTFQQIFGPDSFFLSVQNHGTQEEEQLRQTILKLKKLNSFQAVVTNNTQYIHKEEAFAHECLLAIRDGVKLSDEEREIRTTDEYYLKSKNEIIELFSDWVDELENTLAISSQCNVTIPLHQNLLPKYPVTDFGTADEMLRGICQTGLQNRVEMLDHSYKERLEYELKVISKMNFSDYFLIVWDFMKFAREQKILTGPGRGSAAGSLVAYVLEITDVDPIEHRLLFERFLNPERVTMPDIDIDFPDNRRDDVIEYVANKYGSLHVAQIITFGTLAAKAAIRDTARAFGFNSKELELLSKLIPSRVGISLKEAYQESEDFRKFIAESDHHRKLFHTARTIEGLPRHTSTHAAGVIISEKPLVNHIAIQSGQGSTHLTQSPMEDLEEIGLLKMDFLGLRNLTILDRIVTSIQKAVNTRFNLKDIPIHDEKTFELLSQGKTEGVFQLESNGMKNVLTKLRPSTFEDIVAVNALFRPGPMENIPLFIDRKHGHEEIRYPHPDLKPILDYTYGVIVYQEQIMQIASTMAGFSLGEADLLRRAVGKKKKEILDKERQHFVEGAVARGYSPETAAEVYNLIVKFANYGFNRSHAVAYSMIAYQLAYLKANYPEYFLAALLTSVIGNEDKVAQYIREAKQFNIEILPPSINKSQFFFKVEKNGLRYSIGAIKGIGASALREILKARNEKPFQDLFDFCLRVSTKAVNRKTMESLVFSGAFDEFGEDRAVLLASLDVALEHAELVRPNDGEYDLFEDEESFMLKPKYVEVELMELDAKLQFEKQALGIYLSDHPVTSYHNEFKRVGTVDIIDLKVGNKHISIGVYLTNMKTIRTKKGDVMAFGQAGDTTGEIELVIFPNVFSKFSSLLKEGNILLIQGSVEERNEKEQLIVQKVLNIEEMKGKIDKQNRRLYVKISHSSQSKIIQQMIQKYSGDVPVLIYNELDKKTVQLPRNLWVNPSQACIKDLQGELGIENVVLK
ncbi:DNA polymerase III subunit alpha [Rossellomorea sp. BNER]|uniref:DNA polymerase III subunit alpha n=1 Tax=Rossellomorea sp. BNER TaxID=2962031 RepID=UPI003AF251DD|nr:DNA polymerase III subunit alpha [Rossellomorea sp. BNER]